MSAGRSTTVDVPLTEADQEAIATAHALRGKVDGLRETGQMLHQRGWSLGTSSNYSVVLEHSPLELLLTASGKHKGELTANDFVRVDQSGERIERHGDRFSPENRPSAETMLHVVIAKQPNVGSVLHTHSVWGTLLSHRYFESGGFEISGFEMLKGLEGIKTHETKKWVPIFDNTQDIETLSRAVAAKFGDKQHPLEHGFLIRGHGLYTWGQDLAEARRHIEVFEFLFECIGRLKFSALSP